MPWTMGVLSLQRAWTLAGRVVIFHWGPAMIVLPLGHVFLDLVLVFMLVAGVMRARSGLRGCIPVSLVWRQVGWVALRVLLALGLARLFFDATMEGVERALGDGQQAMAFAIIFAAIGWVAAQVFVATGSVLQFVLRKRRLRLIVLPDLALFLMLAAWLCHAGLSVEFQDSAGASALPSPPGSVSRSSMAPGFV